MTMLNLNFMPLVNTTHTGVTLYLAALLAFFLFGSAEPVAELEGHLAAAADGFTAVPTEDTTTGSSDQGEDDYHQDSDDTKALL